MKKKDLRLFIVLKSILFVLFVILYNANSDLYELDGLFVFVSDSRAYFTPLEEYIKSGNFGLVRLPGIFPVYAPLYFIFGEYIARNLIVLIQFIVSIWSIWMFGKIVFDYFGRHTAIIFIIISGLSIPLMDIVFLGLMDSFSISFLLLSISFYYKWNKTNTIFNLFLSGVFITWSFFLREVAIVPYFLMTIVLLIGKRNFFSKIKLVLIFTAVFILAESSWILTNYYYTDRIILARTIDASDEYKAMYSLAPTFGGRFPKWYEGGWFFDRENDCEIENFPFSERVFTPDYSLDDLIKLKKDYCSLDFDENNIGFLNRVSDIKNSYKKHRWYDYYFLNYFRHLIDYLYHPTVFIVLPVKAWNNANTIEKLLKAYFIINYNVITILGFFGLFLIWFKKKNLEYYC